MIQKKKNYQNNSSLFKYLAPLYIRTFFNQKLSIANRIKNQVAFEDIMDKETGEVFVTAGEVISAEAAEAIENAGINVVDIILMEENLI